LPTGAPTVAYHVRCLSDNQPSLHPASPGIRSMSRAPVTHRPKPFAAKRVTDQSRRPLAAGAAAMWRQGAGGWHEPATRQRRAGDASNGARSR